MKKKILGKCFLQNVKKWGHACVNEEVSISFTFFLFFRFYLSKYLYFNGRYNCFTLSVYVHVFVTGFKGVWLSINNRISIVQWSGRWPEAVRSSPVETWFFHHLLHLAHNTEKKPTVLAGVWLSINIVK